MRKKEREREREEEKKLEIKKNYEENITSQILKTVKNERQSLNEMHY